MEVTGTGTMAEAILLMRGNRLMKKNVRSPRDADLNELWAHLKIRYRDGDEMVDEDSKIWDVWRKEEGYALYCSETKEVIEVPKPKKLGG